MKPYRLIALLFLPVVAWGQSHEILRPVVDVGPAGEGLVTGNCAGTGLSSSGMSASYDAAGLSTSASNTVSGTTSQTRNKGRTFKTWATTANTYTALTLNINSSADQFSNVGGIASVDYSLNGGTTWVNLHLDSSPRTPQTDTVVLSANQDLTKLRVNVCVEGDSGVLGGSGGTVIITVWDVWTDGTYTAAGSAGAGSGTGNSALQPVIISERRGKRHVGL